MSRYSGPSCKLCRREGQKLFLKGFRCDSPKCAMNKRTYPPGEHPWKRGKFSEYGRQLREKQKVKRFYGILEKQFRLYFEKASRARGNTGENLLQLLERRLDNVVYHLGFAQSRPQARQMLKHGHLRLNGKRVATPSITTRVGDVVGVEEKEKTKKSVRENMELSRGRGAPSWLEQDEANLVGTVNELPARDHVSIPIEEQLIVEFCSK